MIEPLLPRRWRGVTRVDDRRMLNGILWRFRTGSPWRDVPRRYGPYRPITIASSAGSGRALGRASQRGFGGSRRHIVMIDSPCVRVHQHRANGKKGVRLVAWDAPAAA